MRLVVLLALVMPLASAAGSPPPDVAALAWLEGRWEGSADGVEMEETWLAPRGGALLGLHRDVKDGRMVLFEFLRIQLEPDGIVYWASPRGRPATAFRLVETGPERAVFANPEHDFPQRILYWRTADGLLHARIEGRKGGKEESEEWTWTRAAR